MNAGYFSSLWPAEDGGPQRLQTAPLQATLGLTDAEGLGAVVRRTCVSTMVVLGAPGEVFLLTHSVLRAHLVQPNVRNALTHWACAPSRAAQKRRANALGD